MVRKMLAHPVEDDHRFVHRVAEHGQHRRQHRQRELPAEDRDIPITSTTSCRLAMIAATENFHSKRSARYSMIPAHTKNSASAPS